jgi:hypothetical protein
MADDVTLPGTGGERAETQRQPDGAHRQIVGLGQNESAALISLLSRIANPIWVDPTVGALRAQLQAGSATIGVVSFAANQNLATVANVTSLNQIGAVPATSMVFDAMQTAWATSLRGRIT